MNADIELHEQLLRATLIGWNIAEDADSCFLCTWFFRRSTSNEDEHNIVDDAGVPAHGYI
jgi:hypothetical protein